MSGNLAQHSLLFLMACHLFICLQHAFSISVPMSIPLEFPCNFVRVVYGRRIQFHFVSQDLLLRKWVGPCLRIANRHGRFSSSETYRSSFSIRRVSQDCNNDFATEQLGITSEEESKVCIGYVKVVFEVDISETPLVLRILSSNHTAVSVLDTYQHHSPNGSVLLLVGARTSNAQHLNVNPGDVGTCEDERRMAEQLLADPYLAARVRKTHIVSGGPSPTLSAAAAAIAARYGYWHCTRPAPGTPASCAALGGCHRRCWWRARRPPVISLDCAAVDPADAAEVERRVAAAGLAIAPPPSALDAELVASVVALPGGKGFLTGLAPPIRGRRP